jgi:hypothetical protein
MIATFETGSIGSAPLAGLVADGRNPGEALAVKPNSKRAAKSASSTEPESPPRNRPPLRACADRRSMNQGFDRQARARAIM